MLRIELITKDMKKLAVEADDFIEVMFYEDDQEIPIIGSTFLSLKNELIKERDKRLPKMIADQAIFDKRQQGVLADNPQ